VRAHVFPVQVETTAPENEMMPSIKRLDGGNCAFKPDMNKVYYFALLSRLSSLALQRDSYWH
jgi:hypothetical protein